jgi:hypothetical protein
LLPTAFPQNLVSIVRVPAPTPQGTFRFAPLKALDPPELAAHPS